MKHSLLKLFICGVCALPAMLCIAADPWPANPLRLVVTFPAGGTIGEEFAAKAAPDGYTLLMATSSHVTNRSSLYTDLPSIGEVLPGYEVALWNGIMVPVATPVEFKQFIAGELDKWARIVKLSGAKVE